MSPWPPLADIARQVNSAQTKAVDNVGAALKAIEENTEYRSIIAITKDRALKRAREIDDQVGGGQPAGRLAGVPFIAKDNFLAFGADTTAGSNILKGFEAPYQATAINKLEAEGAILVAKANLDAFAHGSSTENSDFFTTLNPHDKTRVPGGSSGGSAASIALGIVPFAIGTDTGGSIRQPASFSGIVGYKPTYGLVSRSGVVAMSSSADVIGPLTRTTDDAALVLDIMSGRDELDATTIEKDQQGYTKLEGVSLKSLKLGLIKQYMAEGIDREVKDLVLSWVAQLKQAGASVVEVDLPTITRALAVYYIICPAEISSNLSRYDGQRYQYSYKEAKDLDESYFKTRAIGFGQEAKRRIMIGTYVLSSGYYDAFYKKAQVVRTKLINELTDIFKKVDYLIGPVTPTPAFKIGAKSDDPLSMYLSDVMTVAFNLSGQPAISLPIGKVGNLPVGLQLMADQRGDRGLLSVAKSIEALKA